MKHLMKVLLPIFLVSAALLFAACGNETVRYEITVTSEDSPLVLQVVSVQLKDGNGKTYEAELKDGKAVFDLPAGDYTASLVEKQPVLDSLQLTYGPVSLTAKEHAATIHIVPQSELEESKEYKVTVLLPDGTPAKNLRIQLCGGTDGTGACYPKVTDETGTAIFSLPAGDYEIHILPEDLPSGCTFNDKEYKMTSAGGALTISLKKA